MYIIVLLFPLLNAIFCGLLGRFLGKKGLPIITFNLMVITWLASILIFYEIGLCSTKCEIEILPWIFSGSFQITWALYFDSLTSVMLIVVNSISLLVHIYSLEYMKEDPHIIRFVSYLSLFTFFMIILVTANNFVQLFLGWEGVGLCSYLLISFWYTRLQANKAAIKAMIVNRIGDFGLAFAIFIIFKLFKSADFNIVFPLMHKMVSKEINFLFLSINVINLISILLLIGAVGKSAQLGLHTWLPDAMEGPTPVSALIHAATMVTAGIFLISRCSPIFEFSSYALNIVVIIGACTSFFAATTGLFQNDIKKVIAYSTCSQLGYMLFACGISGYSVGVFHLYNHAFFKALLFLTAGCIIHSMSDEQDMRKMGGLATLLPFSFVMILIGSLALMGFPYLTGFYSKDLILELAFSKYTFFGHYAFWLGSLAAFFTAFYSFRLIYMTFLTKTNSFKSNIILTHESPNLMLYPLALLALGSIFIGFLSKEFMVGIGSPFWNNALFCHPINYSFIDAEFIPVRYKLVPLIYSISGASLSFFLYVYFYKFLYKIMNYRITYYIYLFFNKKWFFDKIYNENIAQVLLNSAYVHTYKLIDKGLIEYLGPFGISRNIFRKSIVISKLQTGSIYHYALLFFVGILITSFFSPFFIISFKFFLLILLLIFAGLIVVL